MRDLRRRGLDIAVTIDTVDKTEQEEIAGQDKVQKVDELWKHLFSKKDIEGDMEADNKPVSATNSREIAVTYPLDIATMPDSHTLSHPYLSLLPSPTQSLFSPSPLHPPDLRTNSSPRITQTKLLSTLLRRRNIATKLR